MAPPATVPVHHPAHRLRCIRWSRPALVLLAACWLATLGNLPLWNALWKYEGGLNADSLPFLLSAAIVALAWTHLILLALAWGRATKFVLALVLVASAAASYFTHTYGVLLDGSMVINILQTHAAEAQDLLTPSMVAWVMLLGALPATFIAGAGTADPSLLRETGTRLLHGLVAIVCLGSVLMLNYQHYASIIRNHRELRLMFVPHNIVAALHAYITQSIAITGELQAVGTDAKRSLAASHGKPMLTILVVGETARAKNFSLNGYPRLTNPKLSHHDLLNFSDVGACGTSTAVSLPCMFTDMGRANYDGKVASRREGLLDVLQHAGIKVLWRDNNSGCKGVCARAPHEDLSASQVPEICAGGECYDAILLHGLQDYIDGLQDDALIVLHMNGSHGPAYFKRYPPSEETFTPACQTADLSRCTRESIINAYDNSIRYTDNVLSQAIQLLQGNSQRFDTAMLYVSDHGESLGENGLYLHGIPYALAPREQIHVPMLVWLSDSMYQRLGLDRSCLAAHQGDAISHDHLFHSVLGLSMVQTAAYVHALDIFRSCRT